MASEAFPADLPICDPHFHCWDCAGHFYNKNLGSIADGPLGTYLPEHYLKDAAAAGGSGSGASPGGSPAAAAGGLPIRSVVHVETVVGQVEGGFVFNTLDETRWLQKSVLPGFEAAGVSTAVVPFVHLGRDDAEAVLAAHRAEAGERFKGIRMILNYSAETPSLTWPQVGRGDYLTGGCPAFTKNFGLLASQGLSFDLHANWYQLSDAAAFLASQPATTVVVDHLGVPKLGTGDAVEDASRIAEWRRGMTALASLQGGHRIYVKISGLEYIYPRWLPGPEQDPVAAHTVKSMVHWVLSTFGPQRCMFASNFPVDLAMGGAGLGPLYRAFLGLARSHPAFAADASGALLRGLFHDVAAEAYKLGPAKA